MRSPGGLKRWPISTQQRAAMRAAMDRIHQVLEHGCTEQEVARARAEIEASRKSRQGSLPFASSK